DLPCRPFQQWPKRRTPPIGEIALRVPQCREKIHRQVSSQVEADTILRSSSAEDEELVVRVFRWLAFERRHRLENVGQPSNHWLRLNQVFSKEGKVIGVLVKICQIEGYFNAV